MASVKEPMSPLPNTRMPCWRIWAAASAIAAQSASPRYIWFKVRPWMDMTCGRPWARHALHSLMMTVSYPRRVFTDRGRAERDGAGWSCAARAMRTFSTMPGFEPGFGQGLPVGPIAQPAFGRGHEVERQFRRFDEPGAAPGRRHVFRRASHVDIQAVEPEFTHHVGGPVKQLSASFPYNWATIGRCPSVYRNGSHPMTRPWQMSWTLVNSVKITSGRPFDFAVLRSGQAP